MSNYEEIFNFYVRDTTECDSIINHGKINNVKNWITPYTHENSDIGSKNIGNLLRKHLAFYTYDRFEIEKYFDRGRFEQMDSLIDDLKQNRLPKRFGAQNGIYSEVMLDLLLMLENDSIEKATIKTIHRQRTDNNELKGFDSIHLINKDDEIILLLGQAKLGAKTYCLSSIKKDIDKMTFEYIYDELYFIAEKNNYVNHEIIANILDDLNEFFFSIRGLDFELKAKKINEYILKKNIKIIVPCLIAYEEPSIYTETLTEKISEELEELKMSLENEPSNMIELDYDLEFLAFPVKSKSDVRAGMGMDNEI